MGEKQDQLLYLDIVRERQQRASELVQESHLIAMSKIQRSNTKLLEILHKLPTSKLVIGCGSTTRDKAVTDLDRPLQDFSSGTRSRTRLSSGRRQDLISGSSH